MAERKVILLLVAAALAVAGCAGEGEESSRGDDTAGAEGTPTFPTADIIIDDTPGAPSGTDEPAEPMV